MMGPAEDPQSEGELAPEGQDPEGRIPQRLRIKPNATGSGIFKENLIIFLYLIKNRFFSHVTDPGYSFFLSVPPSSSQSSLPSGPRDYFFEISNVSGTTVVAIGFHSRCELRSPINTHLMSITLGETTCVQQELLWKDQVYQGKTFMYSRGEIGIARGLSHILSSWVDCDRAQKLRENWYRTFWNIYVKTGDF